MNTFVIVIVSCLVACASAAPSGIAGAVLSGPSGVVTSHGAIGPAAAHGGWGGWGGWGLGSVGLGHGAVLAAPAVASTVVAGPAVSPAAVIGPAVAPAAVIANHGLGLGLAAAPAWGLAHGAGVITNGGGAIGVSGHGATVQGPPTAPVVVAGPAGKVVADGLWGPTANVGLGWGHGAAAAHGW